jgi:multisubunit Na+/H+ antiporter MnhE subunit
MKLTTIHCFLIFLNFLTLIVWYQIFFVFSQEDGQLVNTLSGIAVSLLIYYLTYKMLKPSKKGEL